MNENNTQTHESFGLIQFSRYQGSTRTLFGSSIKHNNIISCTICNGEVERELNTDWFHTKDTIMEFEMSHAQFADMLTNMDSSPVPITFKLKPTGTLKKCEDPPYESIIQKHATEFEEHLENINDKTNNLIKLLNATLDGSKLKKSDKEKLMSLVNDLSTEVHANSKYQLKAFNEQMNKTVTEYKNELEVMIQNKDQQDILRLQDIPKLPD